MVATDRAKLVARGAVGFERLATGVDVEDLLRLVDGFLEHFLTAEDASGGSRGEWSGRAGATPAATAPSAATCGSRSLPRLEIGKFRRRER